MKNQVILFLFFFNLIPFSCLSQTNNFIVTTTGTNPTIDAAIDHAVNIWDDYLITSTQIKLHVEYLDLTSQGPLGITLPNGRKDFISALYSGTWYPSCLANALEGTELNPGENDIDVFMNSASNYYFGTDGNPGFNQYDFVSVILHEIAHGLGIVSLSKVNNNEGSFGTLVASDFAPLSTSFPFPDLEGLPSVWDKMIINNFGETISDTMFFPNNSVDLNAEFESNNLFFNGAIATAVNSGSYPKVFAPNTYDPGSSLSHIDENSFPSSSGNAMMTPFISNGEVNHYPGPLLVALLQDIGWLVDANAHVAENYEPLEIVSYPNPVLDQLSVLLKQPVKQLKIEIFSAQGKIVDLYEFNSNSFLIDMSNYNTGMYFIRCSANGIKKVIPIVKK